MLDGFLRPYIDPPLNRAARILNGWGWTANTVTGIGFIFALASFAALAFQLYGAALLGILLSRLMDGLDGPLARQHQATDLGGFLDIVSDFVFYSGVVFFFALGRPEHGLAAAFLIFSFIGTGSSFLTYAIFATRRRTNHEKQGRKSFFYLSGITEGTETIAVLVLICLLPGYFNAIAVTFGILCWLTTLGRVLQARRDFTV